MLEEEPLQPLRDALSAGLPPALLPEKCSSGGECVGDKAVWPNHLHLIRRICFTSNSFLEDEPEPPLDIPASAPTGNGEESARVSGG